MTRRDKHVGGRFTACRETEKPGLRAPHLKGAYDRRDWRAARPALQHVNESHRMIGSLDSIDVSTRRMSICLGRVLATPGGSVATSTVASARPGRFGKMG